MFNNPAIAAASLLGNKKRVQCEEIKNLPQNGCINPFATPPPAFDTSRAAATARKWDPIKVNTKVDVSKGYQAKPSPYRDATILPKPDWRPLPTLSLGEIKQHTESRPDDVWV